jgi:glutaredoxin
MFLKLVRNALGSIVVFFDWLTRPKSIQRSPTEQIRVQSAFDGLSLYQFRACPFCVKTRRAIHVLGVDVELRDINKVKKYREELQRGGGQVKVPCLRIEDNNNVRWMYESSEIIEYLNQRAAII